MKTSIGIFLAWTLFGGTAMGQTNAFMYQGRLFHGGTAANALYEMQFTLFDAVTNGHQVGTPVSLAPVAVSNGLFTVTLDFGAEAFMGSNRWLEVTVNLYGTDGLPTTLSPRQPILPTPYALHAANAANLMSFVFAPIDIKVNGERAMRLEPTSIYDAETHGAPNVIGGSAANVITFPATGATIAGGGAVDWHGYDVGNVIESSFASIGGGMSNSISTQAEGAVIAGGMRNRIQSEGVHSVIGGGFLNFIDEDAGTATIAGGREHRVRGDGGTISGGWGNSAAGYATVAGGSDNRAVGFYATISGGGMNLCSNYSTISGGTYNKSFGEAATVGGGANNTAFGVQSTVSGGSQNSSLGDRSTVSGGLVNYASGIIATIGGGGANVASGVGNVVSGGRSNYATGIDGATIGGGNNNTCSNYLATVPGGWHNVAGAPFSFAAGQHAQALHYGAFVWADAYAAEALFPIPFTSIRSNEFSVRAMGGVRFVTGVESNGTPNAGVSLATGSGAWSMLSDRNAKENFQAANGRDILDKVLELPVTSWNYKAQGSEVRHIGPMAQDFHAAFGLGESDRTITTVDADGVALAAIQGLNQKVEQTVKEKNAEIAELKKRLETLEKLVESLNVR